MQALGLEVACIRRAWQLAAQYDVAHFRSGFLNGLAKIENCVRFHFFPAARQGLTPPGKREIVFEFR